MKKILFRAFLAGAVLLLLLFIFLFYNLYFGPLERAKALNLVPEDAVFIIETNDPIGAWREISSSELWAHLHTNPLFAEMTYQANQYDSMAQNSWLDLVGKRTVVLSAHMYKRDNYDFLYLIDLGKIAKVSGWLDDYIGTMTGDGYVVTKRGHNGVEVIELTDKANRTTISMAKVKNFLAVSYQGLLVEKAIDQYDNPILALDPNFTEIEQKTPNDGLIRFYFQYEMLDEYMQAFVPGDNPYLKAISQQLFFSGLNIDLKQGSLIQAAGFTNINDTISSYLKAMIQSGKGKSDAAAVAPQRTAFYMGLGFNSFLEFSNNLWQTFEESDPVNHEAYVQNVRKLEKFLKIDLKENFYSWIGDEVAFVQMQPDGLGKNNEFAVVFKTKSAAKAKENLDFINRQIRRRTPVKFKRIEYKGHEINFLSMKGFFKVVLGSFFSNLEKPHFTIIDDYLIFSNHPQTLRAIINDYHAKLTLAESFEFTQFRKNFDRQSNIFIYMNMANLHSSLQGLTDKDTWAAVNKGKKYITCFPQIGFQLTRSGSVFGTNFYAQYLNPEQVEINQKKLAASRQAIKDGAVYLINEATGEVEDTLYQGNIKLDIQEDDFVDLDDISPDNLDARSHVEKHPNGGIKIEVGMKDGQFHGDYTEYFEKGGIKVKGHFKDGQKSGKWVEYDEGGNRVRKVKYKNGKEV